LQVLQPPGLAAGEVWLLLKKLQGHVIRNHFELNTLQKTPPYTQRMHHSKEFLLSGRVVYLSWDQPPTLIRNGVAGLKQHGANSHNGGITDDLKGDGEIRQGKHWCRAQSMLESIKGLLA
jgi:hypothetical protein